MYEVTKVFISGLLKGLTIVEQTSVEFKTGFVCKRPIGGSGYKIVSVRKIS